MTKQYLEYKSHKQSKLHKPWILTRLVHRYFCTGEKVRCNICGSTFKQFMKLKRHQHGATFCPVCGSVESTRVLWFYLSNEVLGKKNKSNILYFSPETAIQNRLKSFQVNVTIPPAGYFVNKLYENQKLKGSSFDVILFSHQLQYLHDSDAVLAELMRMLRPGGFVVLLTVVNLEMERTYEKPESDEDKDRLTSFYRPGITRVFGVNFAKYLARAGFKVEVIDYPDELGYVAQRYYQLGDGTLEVIYKCKK